MGPTSCSVWVERHLTSYSMAYVVLPINAAGDWRGMHLRGCLRCQCWHSWMLMWHLLTWLTLSCPPPSLHPASSSSHLLLDLLFSCPVVVGVRDGCRRAVDVAGVDMAASTCHGRNQRVLVDLDATCGWCGRGWHGASTCHGRNQRVLVDLDVMWRVVDVVCGVWWMWLASMWHVVGWRSVVVNAHIPQHEGRGKGIVVVVGTWRSGSSHRWLELW